MPSSVIGLSESDPLPTEFERLNLDDLGFPKTKNGKDHSFPGTPLQPCISDLRLAQRALATRNQNPEDPEHTMIRTHTGHIKNDTRKESFLRLQQLF